MRWEFTLPDLGEGVSEGEIVAWLVQPGDVVVEDQPMVEIMTDKVTVTIGAPKAGTIAEVRGNVGNVVTVHTVLVVFQLEDTSAPSLPAASAVGDIRDELPGMQSFQQSMPSNAAHAKPLATPAVRDMARTMHLDLKNVPPTGAQGQVTKEDLLRFSQAGPLPAPVVTSSSEAERIPFVGIRRRIALQMQHAKQVIPHATFVEECDVSSLVALRSQLQPVASAHGTPLTFLPFVLKALARSLRTYPLLNATLDESKQEIVCHKRYDIGIATSTSMGLVVPVVRGVHRLSLMHVAREIHRLATAAKEGVLSADEVSGPTFTVTSLGKQSGLLATPIVHFPEAAILGIHQIKKRPVVREDQIVIGHIMLLSLSFDHRIMDGDIAAAFVYDLIEALENPGRLLLQDSMEPPSSLVSFRCAKQ